MNTCHRYISFMFNHTVKIFDFVKLLPVAHPHSAFNDHHHLTASKQVFLYLYNLELKQYQFLWYLITTVFYKVKSSLMKCAVLNKCSHLELHGCRFAGLLRASQPINCLRRLYALGFLSPGKGIKWSEMLFASVTLEQPVRYIYSDFFLVSWL